MSRLRADVQEEDYLAPMLRPGQEGMPAFYRFLVVVAVYITAIIVTAFLIWMGFCFLFNRSLFNSILQSLNEIWNTIKVFAVVAGAIGVFWLAGKAYTSVAGAMPQAQLATFEETENLVVRGLFGTRHYSFIKSPVAERRRVKKLVGTKIELVPPSIALQIQSGLIAVGMPDIVHGFQLKTMTPVRLPASSSLTIGGTGSGKTRGNAYRTLQRTICEEPGGYPHITICDPHATKPDGLAPLLQDVQLYIKIAGTPQEIVNAAKEFYREMEARKAGRSVEMLKPGTFRPRHIFFDEWGALMDTREPGYPYTKEERALLLAVMLGCVREYRGYGGYGHISMQNPKQSNIGDILLRDDMPLLLVHKVSESTCSFLYPSDLEKEKRKQVLALKQRQCFIDYRTNDLQYGAVMPDIPDDVVGDFLRIMQEADMPMLPQPKPKTSRMIELPTRSPLTEQIAVHTIASASASTSEGGDTEELMMEVEVASTSEGEFEPIGREVVLQMLDKMASGEIKAHDFLKWAEAQGGRKYTSRSQAIKEIQNFNHKEIGA